jgi:hypothetical protein
MPLAKPRYYVQGLSSAFRKLITAKKRAQAIANRLNKTVYVDHYDSPGGFKTGETIVTPLSRTRRNPAFPSLFRNYYVICDGKKFGPFKTKAKADKVAVTVARVLDKPAKVMGQPKSKANPSSKCKRQCNTRNKTTKRRNRRRR